MKVIEQQPPRAFIVGHEAPHQMHDCARVHLEPDEQITFVTESGSEYDVARKSWGFYATPSLNGRLPRFGLRPALVRNRDGKHFVFLVERDKEDDLARYMHQEHQSIVCWLDTDESLAALERGLRRPIS